MSSEGDRREESERVSRDSAGVTSAETERDAVTELEARIEVLRAENRRLREEYARARKSEYRRTAVALVAVGLVAVLGGALFASARTVLLALGGTGVFLGVLTYYLAPERVLPPALARGVYGALAANESGIVADLGLRETRVYVPVGPSAVRLFVPHEEGYEVPSPDALGDVFVVGDEDGTRGVAFEPTGSDLVEEFERALTEPFGTDAPTLANQLVDALVRQFELVDAADPDVDPAGGRLTVAVGESPLGPVDEFDHPVASFLGCGVALGLATPVSVAVESADDERAAFRVTCTWDDGPSA